MEQLWVVCCICRWCRVWEQERHMGWLSAKRGNKSSRQSGRLPCLFSISSLAYLLLHYRVSKKCVKALTAIPQGNYCPGRITIRQNPFTLCYSACWLNTHHNYSCSFSIYCHLYYPSLCLLIILTSASFGIWHDHVTKSTGKKSPLCPDVVAAQLIVKARS